MGASRRAGELKGTEQASINAQAEARLMAARLSVSHITHQWISGCVLVRTLYGEARRSVKYFRLESRE